MRVAVVLGVLAIASQARATLELEQGRVALFRSSPVASRNKAVVKFVRDDQIRPDLRPLDCPSDEPTLRIRASNGYDSGDLALPCPFRKSTGRGYKYVDKSASSGGVVTVVYGKQKLIVKLKGEAYIPLEGPLAQAAVPDGFVEITFRVSGESEYCGRFDSFKRDERFRIQADRGTTACLAGSQDCPAGMDCAAFSVVPGSGDLVPVDDGLSTWLRVFDFTGANLFANATNGDFGSEPILFAKGPSGIDGLASLSVVGQTHLGANFLDLAQGLGTSGTVCVRVEQDPEAEGWIDCDAGTDATVGLSVDSRGELEAMPSVLSAPGVPRIGAPVGAAVARVLLRFAVTDENDADCSALGYLGTPSISTAVATGDVTSVVVNDRIGGTPGNDANTVSLSGAPFPCADWGQPAGAGPSVAVPFYVMDFLAPVVEQVVDLAAVFRLQLDAVPFPGLSTPTPAPTSTPAPTPSSSPIPSATPTPSASPSPSATPQPSATPAPTATTIPAILSGLVIRDDTSNFGPDYQAFGNCYRATRTGSSVLGQASGSFSTRFQQSVATDCEAVPTGGGGIQAEVRAQYRVEFALECPAGSNYRVSVNTALVGAHSINRDNLDGCDLPFFGSTGTSVSSVGMVAGTHVAGVLESGSLSLSTSGSLSSASDANEGFAQAAMARLVGVSDGSASLHRLGFSWDTSCTSNGDSFDTGAECAVRLGLESDLDPNGISGCFGADAYPGYGNRIAAGDGHFVEVVADCTFLISGPAPSPTPDAPPTPSPTGSASPTPVATPSPPGFLGSRSFLVAEGPGGYCPDAGGSQSFLKTNGNPTGGIPGTVCNGTRGNFSPTTLVLSAGIPDGAGRAPLFLGETALLAASLDSQTPGCGGACVACWRFANDPSRSGFVDCDGGSNADAVLEVDSAGGSAPPAPEFDPAWFDVAWGIVDAGAGAAVVPVLAQRLRRNGTSVCPGVDDAAWENVPGEALALVTGEARTTITSPRRCSGSLFGTGCPGGDPYEVALSGESFDCASWTIGGPGRLVVPFANLDVDIGGSFGTGDIAQVLRLSE